jgi:Zn-dependent metalloprotease
MLKPLLACVAAAGCVTAALTVTTPASNAASNAAPDHLSRAAAIASAKTNAVQHAGLSRGQDARVHDTVLDKDGSSHVRFTRTYRGLEVVGGDFVVHQNGDGRYASVSGARIRPFTIFTKAAVAPQRAASAAASTVRYRPTVSSPRLVVLATGKVPRLSWKVNVEGRRADGSPAGKYVFVGARSGRVLDSWPSVLNETGSGTGLFVGSVPLETTRTSPTLLSLVDPSRGGNATHNGPATSAPVFTDSDNVWGDGSAANVQTAGVDAAFGIATTWDYYKNVHARNGIANNGVGARSFVHDGLYVNASWNDSCFCMKYGDGGSTTYPLVELDIAGHEMTHGVTSRSANLTYRGESGGLNEATSDIFGTMVEFYAANAGDPADYVIGEEIYKSYNPALNYIRRMDKPSMDGASFDCWSKRVKSADVHYSSGIANHFFYLLSEGSGTKLIGGVTHNSPTCNGSTLTGIGRDAAAKIWYRALTVYMTSSTNYAGARVATLNAASDLFGATSTQRAAVAATWSAVSVS